MSVNSKGCSKIQELKADVDTKPPEITFGSHYALQVALQTMKERCQQLQQRLITVEGENLSLKVELEKNTVHADNNGESTEENTALEDLHQQVTQLQRQKSQLTHHIFMVANENKQLWSRLSRLTQANKSLGNHLSRINDTLSQRSSKCKDSLEGEQELRPDSIGPVSKNDACPNGRSSSESGDTKEESLEEISLKLIKSFRQEKIELEEQYAQMVEIQEGCSPMELNFAAFDPEPQVVEPEDDIVLEEVQNIVDRLRSLQGALQQQRAQLRSSLAQLETIKNEGRLCPRCQGVGPLDLHVGKTAHAEILEVEMENTQMWAPQELQCNIAEPLPADLPAPGPTLRRGSGPRRLTERAASFHAPLTDKHATAPSDNWMCPLCCKVYPQSVNFDEYHQHVMDHFKDEDADSESIVNNFEIIPKDLSAV